MRRSFIAAACTLLLLPALLHSQDPAAAFDAFAAQGLKDWGGVGLQVAVVKDGRIVFARGYGLRELGRPAPVDTNTLFAIGSTTKAMTAAALGLLVDEGKVRWDDPVSRHLPDFQLSDPWVTRELTVRDLLTHRAGLGNADMLWYGTGWTTSEILRRARFIPSTYSMRSGYTYQNIMYAAAGAVVEAASGMSWHDFIRQRILTPLDMAGTVTTLSAAERSPNMARPHDLVDGQLTPIQNASVDGVAAAGSIWSNVADMAKWAMAMIDSGRVNGRRWLSPVSWAEMFRAQTIIPPAQFYPTSRLTRPHWTTYGLGWFQHDYHGRMIQFHTGSIDGMTAIIGLIPEERIGVYVLANRGGGRMELRHALMYKAFDLWLGLGDRDWSTEFRALYAPGWAAQDSARARADRNRPEASAPPRSLDQYAGTYTDSLMGDVRIELDEGLLRLRRGEQSGTLEHWQQDTFRLTWDHRWQGRQLITFRPTSAGQVVRLEMGGGQDGAPVLYRTRGLP